MLEYRWFLRRPHHALVLLVDVESLGLLESDPETEKVAVLVAELRLMKKREVVRHPIRGVVGAYAGVISVGIVVGMLAVVEGGLVDGGGAIEGGRLLVGARIVLGSAALFLVELVDGSPADAVPQI